MSMPTDGPLARYFEEYAGFTYNPDQGAYKQFERLCKAQKWSEKSNEQRGAQAGLRRALTSQFNATYGSNMANVESWHALCTRMGIDPLPRTLEECEAVFARTHVNIVDLVDAAGTQRTVRVFKTVQELAKYSKRTKKYFPRDQVGAGDILKFLLRKIKNPPKGGGTGAATGSGRRARRRRRREAEQGVPTETKNETKESMVGDIVPSH